MIDESRTLALTDDFQPARFERNVMLAAKGTGITFAGKLFAYASRLVTTLVLARLLAAGQYGLYNLGLTVVELATGLASLGMAIALVRFIPHFASRRDEAGLWGTLQVSLGLTMLLSICLAVGLNLLAEPIAVYVFSEPRLTPLLQLLSWVLPFFNLSDMVAAATRGFRNMQYTVIAQNIVQPLIKLSLILGLFIFVRLNARWALTVAGLTEIAVSCLLVYFLNKQFSLKRPLNTGRREIKNLLKFSLPVYLSNQINHFGSKITTVLLSAVGSVTSVGIFALVNQLSLLADMFHSSIVTVSQPLISDLHSRGDKRELGRMYQLMTKWSVTINMPMFLILVLFPGPILAAFGQSFVGGVSALSILAWVGLTDTGTGICGVMLDMTDHTRLKLFNTSATLILSVSMSLLLIPAWGLVGAAVAGLVGSAMINLLRVMEVFFFHRLLPYNAGFIKPILAGCAAAGAVVVSRQLIPPDASLLHLAVDILILLVVYVGVTVLLGFSTEDRAVLARLRRRAGLLFSRPRARGSGDGVD
jgi:O-antigen/teichoic acid export membrane protein